MIRSNQNIKGILIDNTEYKLSQYADDTVLFLDGSENSMNSAFHTLDIFANISGLKVNIEKTQAVWIGSKKHSNDKICNEVHVKWVKAMETFKTLGIIFSTNLPNMIETNYDDVMASIRKLIHSWSRRNLTVLGRVTVVKSLILSKLTFLLLTLPNPSDQFIRNLTGVLYKFIWKGIDKVSRKQMSQDYRNGGLRMVDIQSYIHALKATWIRRLLKAGNLQWVNLVYKLMHLNNILDIEGGSPDILNCLNHLQNTNCFWRDVLKAWIQIVKNNKPICISDFVRSSLWHNENILLGKKTLYYKHWVKNGVNFVNDLLDEKGNFLSLDNFISKYSIRTNFLEYGAVILNCIKKACHTLTKDKMESMQRPFRPFNFEILMLDNKGSRRMYDLLISSGIVKMKFVEKWASYHNIIFDSKKWSIVFTLPFKSTLDTKLRWFQFRLTHRILGVNSFLAKIGKIDSNICTFCEDSEETIFHIFCECPIVLTFWGKIVQWIKQKLNITLVIDKEMQLFGILDYNTSALNLILLLCRFYIYKTKMQGGLPSIQLFQRDATLSSHWKSIYLLKMAIYLSLGKN